MGNLPVTSSVSLDRVRSAIDETDIKADMGLTSLAEGVVLDNMVSDKFPFCFVFRFI